MSTESKATKHKYYLNNRKKIILKSKMWRIKNRDKYNETTRKRNPLRREYKKQWAINNQEKVKLSRKKSKQKNRIKRAKYERERRKNDYAYNILSLLRKRLFNSMLYYKSGKYKHANNYGINYKAIIKHLGPKPCDGKQYEIDHITPLVLYNFNDEREIQEAFKPENHQWLEYNDHLHKTANENKILHDPWLRNAFLFKQLFYEMEEDKR